MLPNLTILQGDVFENLATLADNSVHCCVTSPPYWGLRRYLPKGHADAGKELGSEKTPQEYVTNMVRVFHEVRRVLHPSGVCFLDIGDTYCSTAPGTMGDPLRQTGILKSVQNDTALARAKFRSETPAGLKPKDMCLIPERLLISLQADGWYVRSKIVWAKKSCMPESVTDRPTNSWEPIYLLAKNSKYFYDGEAVKEPLAESSIERLSQDIENQIGTTRANGGMKTNGNLKAAGSLLAGCRNQRNVWLLGPEPYSEAHFATFPTEIPRRAILAGTSAKGCCPKCLAPWERQLETSPMVIARSGRGEKIFNNSHSTCPSGTMVKPSETKTIGWQPTCKCHAGEHIPCTVLDPFAGSFTSCAVALELCRNAIGIELNADYIELGKVRCNVTPGLQLA